MAEPLPAEFQIARPHQLSGPATRAFRGLVPLICPLDAVPSLPAAVDRVERHVMMLITYMNPLMRLGFGLMVLLTDWSPIWRFQSLSRLQRHTPERGLELLKGLAHNRFAALRNIVFPVRAVIQSAYYDQPEVHTAMDYEPVPFFQERRALRSRLMSGEAAGTADMLPGGPPAGGAS